ncbi:hypothetical protein SK128_021320, partial [Halocaridina rubra]
MDRSTSRTYGSVSAMRLRYRYSGAHTTALDNMISPPCQPEMSYTARKYSGGTSAYSFTGGRRTNSTENGASKTVNSGNTSYSSSGYSSSSLLSPGLSSSPRLPYRRGSASSDILNTSTSYNNNLSTSSYSSMKGLPAKGSSSLASGKTRLSSPSPGYSSLSRYASNASLSSYASRYSAEKNGDGSDKGSVSSGIFSRQSSIDQPSSSPGRYSRSNSGEIPSYSRQNGTDSHTPSQGRYSRHNSGEIPLLSSNSSTVVSRYSRQNSAELSSSPSPTPGYATLERRTNRRKREYMTERRSAERIGDSISYSNTVYGARKKYGRTYSCDLPNHRLATRNYTLTKSESVSSCRFTGDRSGFDGSSTASLLKNGRGDPSCGGQPIAERERSPSVAAIYEGLARINEALQKYGTSKPSNLPVTSASHGTRALMGRQASTCSSTDIDHGKASISSTTSTTPTSLSSSVSLDPGAIKEALGGYLSPKVTSPRNRVNNFFSKGDSNSVDKQVNLSPEIVIP